MDGKQAMKEEIKFEPPIFCSFCGRPRRLVSQLVKTDVITNVYAPHPICICDECIDAAYALIHGEAGESNE